MHLPSPELLIGRSRARLQALRLPAPELLVSRARARLTAPTTHLPSPELLIERRRAGLRLVSGELDTAWQRSLQTFQLRTERQRLSPIFSEAPSVSSRPGCRDWAAILRPSPPCHS